MGSRKTESCVYYVNHLWLPATISRKGLNIPFIFSVSCYFIPDFVVKATTIIFERTRSQDTNIDKRQVWEGGGNVSVGKHSMQQGNASDMFCFSEHWDSIHSALRRMSWLCPRCRLHNYFRKVLWLTLLLKIK